MKPLLILCFAVFSLSVLSQSDLEYDVQGTFAKKLGTTRPVAEVLDARRTSPDALERYKSSLPGMERNFANAESFEAIDRQARPKGPDPLALKNANRTTLRLNEPLLVTEGVSEAEAVVGVPDPNGDVSDNYFVQVVNATEILVMDKEGNRLAEPFPANTIWTEIGQQSAGDPIILYDHEAGRWFLAEFPFSNNILLAVSETEDPLGAWTVFTFATPSFPDYPKFSIWPTAYLMTVNEFGDDGIIFYSINREKILAGEETVDIQRHSITRLIQPGVQSASPVGWTGDVAPADDVYPMIVRINDDGWGNVEQDQIELFEVDTDWDNPDSTEIREIVLPTTPFNAEFCENVDNIFVCVPQPNDNGLEHISGIPRIIWHRVSYRNFGEHGSVVLNFGVDVTGETDGGLRWMELRKKQGEEWSIYQEGTYGTLDGVNRYLGAINIDAAGNIGLGYAMSSESMYASLGYTGRFAGDPLGEMTFEEKVIGIGEGASITPRFGDYHSMAVDRNDVFWFTGQYITDESIWSTKIAAFKLQREQNDLGVLRLFDPVDSTDLQTEEIKVEVRNFGLRPQDTFAIGLLVDNEPFALDTIIGDTLQTDSVFVHTFSKPFSFDSVKTYQLTVFTALEEDDFRFNDTLRVPLTRLGFNDAAIIGIDSLSSRECSSTVAPTVVIQNAGLDTLRSLLIEYTVGTDQPDTLEWTGALGLSNTAAVDITLEGLDEGAQAIEVAAFNPNGAQDENRSNDAISADFEVFLGGDDVHLLFFLDNAPQETSWAVLDSMGNEIFSGGPYEDGTRIVEDDWCLDYGQCYRFVIYDSAGDGMVAPGSEGMYEIINTNGQIVATLGSPFFEFSDTTEFCPDFECLLTTNPFVRHTTAPGTTNGLINLFSSGGIPPILYSIDGGLNFQTSPLFFNLPEGQYNCIVRDAANCQVVQEVTIFGCTVGVTATATDATNDNSFDGTITVTAFDNVGDVRYSIDDGDSFQDDPFFEGLPPGQYDVVVLDSLQCSSSTSVAVGKLTSVGDIDGNSGIKVYPNPSDGVYFFEVEGLSQVRFLPYSVYDIAGRRIASYEAGSFDGVIKGAFSIINQPDGIYTIRFEHPDFKRSTRIIKATGR